MFLQLLVRSALATLFALALPAAGWAGGPQPGDLFGSTGQIGGSLILIDPGTGGGTLIGPLGSFGPVSEIEFRSDGVLFGTTGGGSANLVTIAPGTGTETLVGQHDLFGAVNGLAFVGNTLYGSFFEAGDSGGEGDGLTPSSLVIVDQVDASLTVIGGIDGFSPVRGLAYDAASATMYGVGLPFQAASGRPAGFSDVLFTVDLTTGEPTVIGATGAFLGTIAFGPDGTLYGGEVLGLAVGQGTGAGWGDAPANPDLGGGSGRLFTLDTATGVATPVGATGFPVISGLSFLPGDPEPGQSVLEIPSLSSLGLLLLAGLLAAAGLIAVRRG